MTNKTRPPDTCGGGALGSSGRSRVTSHLKSNAHASQPQSAKLPPTLPHLVPTSFSQRVLRQSFSPPPSVSLGPALSCPLSRTGSSPGAPCPDPHIPARAAQQLPVLRLSSPSTLALDRTTIVPDESFESVLEFRHFRPDSTNYPLPVFPLPQASLRVFLTASRHKQSTFANVCRRSFLQALPNTLSSLSGCVGSSHREDTGSE